MKKALFCLMASASALCGLEEADLVWEDPGYSAQEYNGALQDAVGEQDWWAVIDYATIISYNFPASPYAQEAPFLIGEAYFKLGQLELANESFTTYLTHASSPKHFEEAIYYKFTIAEQFAAGTKKRLFSSTKFPAWLSAREDAVSIYDDVIAAMPHADIAAQALLGKARTQGYLEEFKPSVETLDLLIRRFPKSELAAEAYLEKNRMFLSQCKAQNLDPDLLDLAELNLRKFRLAFPRESRVGEAEKVFAEMQEVFAQHMLNTGRFFEKTKKFPASILYYTKVIAKYPSTEAAETAREKLENLQAAGKF